MARFRAFQTCDVYFSLNDVTRHNTSGEVLLILNVLQILIYEYLNKMFCVCLLDSEPIVRVSQAVRHLVVIITIQVNNRVKYTIIIGFQCKKRFYFSHQYVRFWVKNF